MIDRDLEEAKRIAVHLWVRHYKSEDCPNFELLDDMGGVLSQIDNMVAGLQRIEETK